MLTSGLAHTDRYRLGNHLLLRRVSGLPLPPFSARDGTAALALSSIRLVFYTTSVSVTQPSRVPSSLDAAQAGTPHLHPFERAADLPEPSTPAAVSSATAVSRSSPTTRATVSLRPTSASRPAPASASSATPPRTRPRPTRPTPSLMPSASSVVALTTRRCSAT